MPSLIDFRRRIRSVKNTQQITKAMKMVSAAKLRRAQDAVIAAVRDLSREKQCDTILVDPGESHSSLARETLLATGFRPLARQAWLAPATRTSGRWPPARRRPELRSAFAECRPAIHRAKRCGKRLLVGEYSATSLQFTRPWQDRQRLRRGIYRGRDCCRSRCRPDRLAHRRTHRYPSTRRDQARQGNVAMGNSP